MEKAGHDWRRPGQQVGEALVRHEATKLVLLQNSRGAC